MFKIIIDDWIVKSLNWNQDDIVKQILLWRMFAVGRMNGLNEKFCYRKKIGDQFTIKENSSWLEDKVNIIEIVVKAGFVACGICTMI